MSKKSLTEAVEAWKALDADARAWYLGDRPQDPEPAGDVQQKLCDAADDIVRAATEPETSKAHPGVSSCWKCNGMRVMPDGHGQAITCTYCQVR